VNNELERLWKDVMVTGFDILSWHMSGTAKESHDNLVKITPESDKQCSVIVQEMLESVHCRLVLNSRRGHWIL
jgi:hypothetical protein